MIASFFVKLWHLLTRPTSIISMIGLGGFLVDMFWKPISNAGLILLLAVSAPWLLKSVKRFKFGDLEVEGLSPAESGRKLEDDARELIEAEVGTLAVAPEEQDAHVLEKKPADASQATEEDQSASSTQAPISTAPVAEQSGLRERRGLALHPSATQLIERTKQSVYMVEKLVLQHLQTQLGVAFTNEVKIAGQYIDAVAETSPAPTLIEVVAVISNQNIGERLDKAGSRLMIAGHEWRRMRDVRPRLLLVVAAMYSRQDDRFEDMTSRANNLGLKWNIDVQVVSAHDIARGLGVDLDSTIGSK